MNYNYVDFDLNGVDDEVCVMQRDYMNEIKYMLGLWLIECDWNFIILIGLIVVEEYVGVVWLDVFEEDVFVVFVVFDMVMVFEMFVVEVDVGMVMILFVLCLIIDVVFIKVGCKVVLMVVWYVMIVGGVK